jgi:hypothetical protein
LNHQIWICRFKAIQFLALHQYAKIKEKDKTEIQFKLRAGRSWAGPAAARAVRAWRMHVARARGAQIVG